MPVTQTTSIAGEEPTYTRSVFEAILAGTGKHDDDNSQYVLSQDGVRVKEVDPAGSLAWHPRCEVMTIGSSNLLGEPCLRFPFTARQLAALMTDGWGAVIQEKYGAWQNGPDEDKLLSIDSRRGEATRTLRAAYAAFRHAVEMAPKLQTLENTARELSQPYGIARAESIAQEELRKPGHSVIDYATRLAQANDAVGNLGPVMRETSSPAKTAYAQWRRAVIQHLLLPIEDVPAESFESLTLQSVPPDRRAEALHQMQSKRELANSATGKDLWVLMDEISDIEQEIRDLQVSEPETITERKLKREQLKEFKTQLADLSARVKDINRNGGGKQPGIDAAEESEEQRQQRRLADLRALGGDWVKRGGDWGAKDRQSGAFAKLVDKEKSNGSRNCSEKSVRLDLSAAAQAEADAKRSGLMIKSLGAP